MDKVIVCINMLYEECTSKSSMSSRMSTTNADSVPSSSSGKHVKRYCQFLTESISLLPARSNLDIYLKEAVHPLDDELFEVLL